MKEWTVMLYLAGDNNLSGEMANTLEQIKSVTDKNENIDLFVYFDGSSRNVPTLYCDFTDRAGPIKYFRSFNIKDKLIERESRRVFNENSASMNNVINFIDWCVKKDKHAVGIDGAIIDRRLQKRYALIFSGHSFGFHDWGLLKDDASNYYMTLSKLRWLFERITFPGEILRELAVTDQERETRFSEKNGKESRPWSDKKVLERTTEILGRRLDLLGFDSCEMSSLEIASQFFGLADAMVASEGTVPNSGWNYADIFLDTLRSTTDADASRVAVSFVDSFIKRQNRLALADASTDMSAWNLNSLPPLEAAFEVFAQRLLDCFADKASIAYRQMLRLLTYVHWQCQTYSYEQHVDLGDLCNLLINEINLLESEIRPEEFKSIGLLRESCAEIVDKVRECVLLTGYSGSDFQFSKGVSLFFPWSLASYESSVDDYKNLAFIQPPRAGEKWNEFLEKYLGEISLRSANPLTPVDLRGAFQIPGGECSVIYESYTLLDETTIDGFPAVVPATESSKRPPDTGKRPPDTGKRPPDTGKRPPDTGKRPPDTGKGVSSNMSVFLSRFMKLKNVEPSWNRTGFTSSHVEFERGGGTAETQLGERSAIAKIVIPMPTRIESILDKLGFWIQGSNGKSREDLTKYLNFLRQFADEADEDSKIQLFGRLEQSSAFLSEGELDDLDPTFEATLADSISMIDKEEIKTSFLNKLASLQ